MKIQAATIVLTVLVASIFTSSQAVAAYDNHYNLTVQLDRTTYLQGETLKLSGTIVPLKEKVPVIVEILDPSGNVYFAGEVLPESDADNAGLYSYQFKLGEDAPAGLWSINAKYASKYMLYDKTNALFRVSESIDVLSSPFLQVTIDGKMDSGSGEWAHKYDSKYWKPYQNDPIKIEGNIAFNSYYSNGVLYAVFDVPDKKFDAKDFVELGIDIKNVGEKFKTGDEVYVFRIFRDGTLDSFRLGTEHLAGENSVKHYFSAKAEEAGDIRMQVFDENGHLLKALNSLRDISSTSYKGMLGIAGIEVDREGNLYVLDSDSGIISKFTPEGELLGSFGSLGTEFKEFIDPTGIAIDSEGNIYVADTGNARVQKFDRQGRFVGAFGSMGILSLGMVGAGYEKAEENKRHELFESPEGILVGLSGNLYVVDRRTGNVNIFDSDGNYVKSFGSMVSPSGIAGDSQGNIYVVEQGNNRVMKFDQHGNILDMWGTFGIEDGMFKTPYGIAIDSKDNVYIADSVNYRIQKFDSNGNFIAKWGTKGTGGGQFSPAHGLAVDSSDNLYVVDTRNYRIQKFDSNGNFITEWGSKGSSPGSFTSAENLAIDSQGNIYVTDLQNKKIQKFNGDGIFVLEWGSEGVGAGEFKGPFGIAIDNNDKVYVTDPFNRRVQKFDTDGNLLLRWGSSDVKEVPSIKDIPKGEHYIALDTDSHTPVGVIDAKLVKEHGKGSYLIESGKIWKILHIYKDTIYVKTVDYVRGEQPILSWKPDGIDVDPYGNVYIVDRENEIAKKFDSSGSLISKWGSTGAADGEFSKPTAMDLDSQNNVYIVDTGNHRIQKFDSDGNFVAKWGSFGQGTGQFSNPRGIAIDGQDSVYVLDNGNNRIQKFDGDGNFITEWGSKGSSPGKFDNLSTEGIAVDLQGRVYVADLPGENKATHWIAEVAIPLFLKGDTFGLYLAEGTYGEHLPLDLNNPNAVKIYDVYRKAWPETAISILPGTWAKAKLTDGERIKAEPTIILDHVKSCTNELCSNLYESANPVPAGNNVIVTASITLEQAPDKFEYDGAKITLQYSYDSEEWTDADSKFVLVSKGVPAAVNLKWTPTEPGDVKLRVTSSGLLTEQSASKVMNLKVQESELLQVKANMKWSQEWIMQDEPANFEVAFAGTDDKILNSLNYDLRILKDHRMVAHLPMVHTENGKAAYQYKFEEPGLHIVQVRINAIGSADDFIPMKKVFNYKIDILPVDSPVKVNTVQNGESMKIAIKNRDISNLHLNSIAVSLANIDKIDFKLPESWTSSVNTESQTIQFSTESDPLIAGESIEFTVRSKAFTKSLYSVCWDLEQSTLIVKLC